MEDLEYKALAFQFGHGLALEESKLYDKKNLKRSEPAVIDYSCVCRLCSMQSKDKFNSLKFNPYSLNKSSKDQKGFTWLLEKLGEISVENSYKLNIPDTAIFKKGKAAFLI